MSQFNNKVAIVTGSASGIGKGIAEMFVKEGAKVVLVDINEEKLNQAVEEFAILYNSDHVTYLTCNLQQSEVIQTIYDHTLSTFGTIDILVNCAGIYPSTDALNITEDEWDRLMDLNLKSSFFLSQQVATYMVDQEIEGNIINITSSASITTRPGVAHYSASKAALKMLTQTLAIEWAQYGIRVNALAPGLVETETLQNTLVTEEAIKEHEEKISYSPMGRTCSVEEIANGVRYLASEDASFVTGQTLFVDGGYTAGRVFQTKKKEGLNQ
ncbi:SDR family NAD(P)-dependent oxidoreductase [Salirhabdus salicampi]|uniref:SDR family NAD(P)-dependent oxidoreductase n=1 Tax=Salirhabdus salicampi TaxID=476102 RepID=UPI0020C4CE41|nr:SDR family oxidoreductase [Salirhabdus salicampi]MCP8615706.1 SDR family oxidoreductase [Salirhabdus salicampi]